MIYRLCPWRWLLWGLAIILTMALVAPLDAQALAVNLLSRVMAHGLLHSSRPASLESLAESEALALVPENQRARLLGRLLMARGEYGSAREMLERGLQVDPADRLTRVFLAETYDRLGQPDKALAEWLQAGAFGQLLARGKQAAGARQWDEANHFLEAAGQIRPYDSSAIDALMRAYEQQGALVQAAVVLQRAISTASDAERRGWWLHLGRILEKAGRWQEAGGVYRDGIAAFPDSYQFHLGLGRSYYWGEQRLPEALAEIERAMALAPNSDQAYVDLAKILRAEKRYAEALENYGRAAELSPESYWPLSGQASVLMDMGDAPAAIRLLEEAAVRFPEESHLYYLLAHAYRQGGKTELAIAAAERSVALDTANNMGLRLTLARTYEAGGRTEDAIAEYRAILAVSPNQKDALEGLARLQKE